MYYFRITLFFLIFFYSSTLWAIDFDIWSTGISRQEMTNLAKKHNLPLAKEGLYHSNKTFNTKLLAGDADRFYYNTTLLNHPARVLLLLSPRKGGYGQFLYEIEVTFTDLLKNKDLKPYLQELLENKYGRGTPSSPQIFGNSIMWSPNNDSEVRLTHISSLTLQLKYTDLKIKSFAKELSKSTSMMPSPPSHSDSQKF